MNVFVASILLYKILFLHPLHIAVSDLELNEESKSLEITHKIFIDDFETSVEKEFDVELKLDSSKEHPEAQSYIQQYIEKFFTLDLNGKETKANFVGYETDYEAIWIYQEIPKVKKVKEVTVWSRFLFNIFEDQRNIVHFDYLEGKKSYLFGTGDLRERTTF